MTKLQIIEQLREATRLDYHAKDLELHGHMQEADDLRWQAKDLRDAAYRCM